MPSEVPEILERCVPDVEWKIVEIVFEPNKSGKFVFSERGPLLFKRKFIIKVDVIDGKNVFNYNME